MSFDPNKKVDYTREELLTFYRQQTAAGRQSLTLADLTTGRAHFATAEEIRHRFTTQFGERIPAELAIRLTTN